MFLYEKEIQKITNLLQDKENNNNNLTLSIHQLNTKISSLENEKISFSLHLQEHDEKMQKMIENEKITKNEYNKIIIQNEQLMKEIVFKKLLEQGVQASNSSNIATEQLKKEI